MAEVRTGVHVFAICVKTGIIFKMRSTSFFHVSVPNIYGTSSSTYLIIFLKVIPKVLFFNITQKFTNLLVQLSIFLIDLFVGTYRLSSHARLEAFVIQTKLKLFISTVSGQACYPPDPQSFSSYSFWWRSFTVTGTNVALFPY